MRKERLTYRDLLRRLLSGRLLRLDERRRAEDVLSIPDDFEVAVRLGGLLEELAERGATIRLAARPGDRRNVHRYLDPVTSDYWTIELPGPAAVHPGGRPPGAPPAPAPAAPRAEEPAAPRAEEEESAAEPSGAEAATPAAPGSPAPAPPVPPTAERPRLVQTVEELQPVSAIPARFRDETSGEPQRTLFSSFAPCATPEEIAEALAPIRAQALRLTTADDVHFHVIPEDGEDPVFVPIRDDADRPLHALGGRVQSAVMDGRRALHVPSLQAKGTGAAAGESGALLLMPLASGGRVAGVMEVLRAEPGAFDPDEIAFLALCAEVAAGVVTRATVLEKLIFVDRLTGLYNRAYFDDQIEREIERANRMGTSVALFMADLDHFKRINDTHGHQVGDQALAHVAAIIRSNIRQIDVAARYGGEEFAVLLPSITRARAARTAERLRRVVADTKFGELIPELESTRVSISLGFALYPDDAATAKQLIERADRVALYAAKHNGRNRVVPWSAARDQRVRVKSE